MQKQDITTSANELDRTLDRLISLSQQMKLCVTLLGGTNPGRPRKRNIGQISVYAAKWPVELDRSIADLQTQRERIAAFVRGESVSTEA